MIQAGPNIPIEALNELEKHPNIELMGHSNTIINLKAQIKQMENQGRQYEGKLYQKKGGTHKMPNGKIMLNSKMKTGGATKATKFAALAPPFNKATAADRIAGAQRNMRKKK